MPTSKVSGNQIDTATEVTVTGLEFAGETSELKLPAGTQAQRPAGAIGLLRFNTTEDRIEQYVNTAAAGQPGWVKVKAGGSVGGLGEYGIIKGNARSIDNNIVIPSVSESPQFNFENCFSVGPVITVDSGYSVTVGEGCEWTIVETGLEPSTLDTGGTASILGPNWPNIGSADGLGEYNLIRGNARSIDHNITINYNPSQGDYEFESSFTVGSEITIETGNTVTVTDGVVYELID